MSSGRLESIISCWNILDLPGLQGKLDASVESITLRQDECELSRKSLIETYTSYLNSEDKSGIIDGLISTFQSEIDSLTSRSIEAEKAVLSVYSSLTSVDSSEMTPLLESLRDPLTSISKISDLEIEVSALREALRESNVRLSKGKTKDKRIAEYKARLDAYDRNIDATLRERIVQVKEGLSADCEAKVLEASAEKESLTTRLKNKDQKLLSLETEVSYLRSELFDLKGKREENSEAKNREFEILVNDLESATSRYEFAERELSNLKNEIRLKEENNKYNPDVSGYTNLIEIKNKEIQKLDSQNAKLIEEKGILEKTSESLASEHRDEMNRLKTDITNSKILLDKYSDYETIRKELNILKSLEFGQEEGTESEKPLEILILEKSKILTSENSSLRMENSSLHSKAESLRSELESTQRELFAKIKLSEELEKHVEALQSMSVRGEAEGKQTADILGEVLNSQKEDDPGSLLPILVAQRDRLKKKVQELEASTNSLSFQIKTLDQEKSKIQTDNVKLYEKIKFLQTPGKSGSSLSDEVESRYQSDYERNINPFVSFNNREKTRQMYNLNIMEKVILSAVRFAASNKTARIFGFIYFMILHCLVFAVLMHMAYQDANARDSAAQWSARYSQHMEDFHPGEAHTG